MRQTLLRFVPDWWAWGSYPDRLDVGVGYLLALWVAYGVYWFLKHGNQQDANVTSSLMTWCIVAAVLAFAPGRFPGGVPVYGYGFMLFVGFIFAGFSATKRARISGIPTESVWDVGVWIFFSGILGARLFYLTQKREQVFSGKEGAEILKAAVNLSDGGLVLYGGVILGAFAYMFFCYRRKINPMQMGDVLIPSIFIGLAFGRAGCFLNGCCFGDRCDLPWGVEFPANSVPWQVLVKRGFLAPTSDATFPLHPTQIYSVINAMFLFLVTSTYFRYRPQNGAVLAVGFCLYPLSRIVLEWLRGDELGQFGTGLTISMWVSLGLSACSIAYLAYITRRPASEKRDSSSSMTPA